MLLWKEMMDQWERDFRSYAANAVITPTMFMGYIAEGFREANYICKLVTNTKTIAPTGSPKQYDLGRDVQEILLVLTPEGYRVLGLHIQTQQRMQEESLRGYNEIPHQFSRRRGAVTDGVDAGEMMWYNGEAVTFRRHANTLQCVPELSSSDSITVKYVQRLPEFSASEPLYAPWFVSDTAFMTNFTTTHPDDQWDELIRPAQQYALMKFFENSQPDIIGQAKSRHDFHMEKFMNLCQIVIDNKQDYSHGLTPGYSQAPYSY